MSTTTMELGDVREGMVLGADVCTASGQLLLAAGAHLTERHLRLLAANGVGEVVIGNRTQGGPATEGMSAEQIEHHLLTRFGHNNEAHPLIRELKRICRSRLDGRIDEGGDRNDN